MKSEDRPDLDAAVGYDIREDLYLKKFYSALSVTSAAVAKHRKLRYSSVVIKRSGIEI